MTTGMQRFARALAVTLGCRVWAGMAVVVALALGLAGCGAHLPDTSRSGDALTSNASQASGEFAEQPVDPLQLSAVEQPDAYAYLTLGAADQERYRIMYDAFKTREPRDYPDADMDEIGRIRDCVLADHPELFYVGSVHMTSRSNALTGAVTNVTIEGRYAYSEDEVARVLAAADAALAECFATLPADADDYAKAKCAYEYLATTVVYDHAAAAERGVIGNSFDAESDEAIEQRPDQNIEGAFVLKSAVCGGYASAFQYLLQHAGVQCAYVTGIADGQAHAWCTALLDGAYYYIDPTWADLQYYDAYSREPLDAGAVSYEYLNVTSADMRPTHAAESSFTLPECTATADNYFVREGLLFDWADEERLASIASEALAAGRQAQVRCADAEVFASLYGGLVASGRLAEYLSVSRYRYSCSEDLLTISVFPATSE